MAAPPAAAAVGMLELEFRALAQEARSKEGLAGFFSSTADQQAVKDAAERVILKVRSCGEAPDAMDQMKTHYQVGEAAAGCKPNGHVSHVKARIARPSMAAL